METEAKDELHTRRGKGAQSYVLAGVGGSFQGLLEGASALRVTWDGVGGRVGIL